MRCLVVDDHPLTRDGTTVALLAVRPSMEVLEASCLREALNALSTDSPVELILLDLDLGDSCGVETLVAVKQRLEEVDVDARVVVLSGRSDAELLRSVIGQYATGFILKASPRPIFEHAIALTLAGGVYIPEILLKQMGEASGIGLVGEKSKNELSITVRETEVAALLIRGLTYKRIARELERMDGKEISEHTVRAHVGNLAWKLGVTENVKSGVMAEIARRGLKFPVIG